MALGAILKTIVGPLLGPLVDKIPDVNERNRLAVEVENNILNAMTGVVMAQIEVNKEEAKHTSVFVAGWRPAVGWICGIALAYNFIVQPIMMWVAFLFGVDLSDSPTLDTGQLFTVLIGMLGLGGMRSFEKQKGVARNSINGAKRK